MDNCEVEKYTILTMSSHIRKQHNHVLLARIEKNLANKNVNAVLATLLKRSAEEPSSWRIEGYVRLLSFVC